MLYTPLLHKIANGFGFEESEARDLTERAVAYARKNPAADCYPLRVWLSKIMVHMCTTLIGSRLFDQCGCASGKERAGVPDGDYCYKNAGEQKLQDMPLSFRAVYILGLTLGFTNSELSIMLNTTPSEVTERHRHALAFLARQK